MIFRYWHYLVLIQLFFNDVIAGDLIEGNLTESVVSIGVELSKLNGPCWFNTNCAVKNTTCQDERCVCIPQLVQNDTLNQCLLCNSSSQCSGDRVCVDHLCRCKQGYVDLDRNYCFPFTETSLASNNKEHAVVIFVPLCTGLLLLLALIIIGFTCERRRRFRKREEIYEASDFAKQSPVTTLVTSPSSSQGKSRPSSSAEKDQVGNDKPYAKGQSVSLKEINRKSIEATASRSTPDMSITECDVNEDVFVPSQNFTTIALTPSTPSITELPVTSLSLPKMSKSPSPSGIEVQVFNGSYPNGLPRLSAKAFCS